MKYFDKIFGRSTPRSEIAIRVMHDDYGWGLWVERPSAQPMQFGPYLNTEMSATCLAVAIVTRFGMQMAPTQNTAKYPTAPLKPQKA
jgi:hypothetical protein